MEIFISRVSWFWQSSNNCPKQSHSMTHTVWVIFFLINGDFVKNYICEPKTENSVVKIMNSFMPIFDRTNFDRILTDFRSFSNWFLVKNCQTLNQSRILFSKINIFSKTDIFCQKHLFFFRRQKTVVPWKLVIKIDLGIYFPGVWQTSNRSP